MARYALVIGISQYKSQQLQPLPESVTDAEDVAQVLKQYGKYEVTRLPQYWNADKKDYEVISRDVTKNELDQSLKQFLLETAKGSEALIYFSGHGISVHDKPVKPSGYLATSDCQVEKKDGKYIEQKYAYSLEGLIDLVCTANLSSLVVILDCCHSGHLLDKNSLQQSFNQASSEGKSLALIAACRSFEQAFIGEIEEKYSNFTAILLKGLSRENANRNGEVDVNSLFGFIGEELKGQEPVYSSYGSYLPLVEYEQLEPLDPIPFNDKNPYLGLKSFEAQQAECFGGREEAIADLVSRINISRFLTVIGASGCGKSSLIKAGLLPKLESIVSTKNTISRTITPGENALNNLVNVLDELHRLDKPFVLFIDQFEEIFTQCKDDEQRKQFFRLMAEEYNTNQRQGQIILAMRGDFLDQCAGYTEIADLVNLPQRTTYMVKPLSIEELKEAIIKPAKLRGVNFEPGLVEQMAEDVFKQTGALPLLQYALWALWIECIEKPESPEPLLTWQGYKQIGEVAGALDKRANDVYNRFTSEAEKDTARRLFLELVDIDDEDKERVTRHRVQKESLEEDANSQRLQKVANTLINERLIVVTTERHQEEFVTYLSVTHEALLTQWGLLRNWIAENRENIRLNHRFEELFKEWKEKFKKSDDALITGARLTDIIQWKQTVNPPLSVEENEFIDRSVKKRDKELQEKIDSIETQLDQQRKIVHTEKQKRRIAIAAGCLATVALGFGLLAQRNQYKVQQKEAEVKQQETINAVQLIDKAEENLAAHNQFEALTASVEALSKLKEIKLEEPTYIKRLQTVISRIQERNRFQDHQGVVYGVSFSPDGKIIASAGLDKNIILWNLDGKVKPFPIKDIGQIWSVKFSHDGHFLASAGIDKTNYVKLWTIKGQSLRPLYSLTGHQSSVQDISFSKDSQLLASSSFNGDIKVWDIKTGSLLRTLRDRETLSRNDYRVYGVDFSPINKLFLISAGFEDCDLRVWDLSKNVNDDSKCVRENFIDRTTSVRFNPKSNVFISSNVKGWIKIWNIEGHLINKFKAHDDGISSIEFSADGKFFASAGWDKKIKIWDFNEALKKRGTKQISLLYPVGMIEGYNGVHISFHPNNSQIIASTSEDKNITVWDWKVDERYLNTKVSSLDVLLTRSCQRLKDYQRINKKVFKIDLCN